MKTKYLVEQYQYANTYDVVMNNIMKQQHVCVPTENDSMERENILYIPHKKSKQ